MIRRIGFVIFLFILAQYTVSAILGKYYFNFFLNPILNLSIICGAIKLLDWNNNVKGEHYGISNLTLLKSNRNFFIGLLSLFLFARLLIDVLLIITKGYEYYADPNEQIGFSKDMRVLMITSLIVAPIMEEKLFRQKILNIFLIKFSKKESILFVSLLFSFTHVVFDFHLDTLIVQFLLSILLSLIYLKSGSLFIARIAHFFWNILWYIEAIILGYSQIYFSFTYSYLYLACILVISVLLFLKFKRTYAIDALGQN